MKTQTGYRFSLQFAAETEEQVRVGEFLERMGNRKSAVIIDALCQYLEANPSLEASDVQIKVQAHLSLARQEIESLIRKIIEERLGKSIPESSSNNSSNRDMKLALEEDITSMLSNLSMFG